MADDKGLLTTLLGFCTALRDGGLKVGTDDAMAYTSAAALLNPTKLEDLYWAGRVTLVHSRDQIEVYNAAFTRYFLGGSEDERPGAKKPPASGRGADAVFDVPSGERPDHSDEDEDTTRLGAIAATVVVDRSKSFSECTEEELESLRRIISKLRVAPPTRRTRRRRSSPAGKNLDLRRMARETMRSHGEPGELTWLERRAKPRPLVLILDISGSMADYSRNLLQFAHSTKRAAGRVEVFCFGTHLTRITPSLRRRDPDEALALAGQEARDWAGGTRIGASLDQFVRSYARRGMARGAIVVICSDGLDRGDPELLDDALERLGRLCHRIVWMNPLKGDLDEYTATSLGMSVALPHIDLLWSGHNLTSLEAFAGALPDIR
ncbi:MAG TPA: VWA domain-containing protein [Acidimicrobiia bacterium]